MTEYDRFCETNGKYDCWKRKKLKKLKLKLKLKELPPSCFLGIGVMICLGVKYSRSLSSKRVFSSVGVIVLVLDMRYQRKVTSVLVGSLCTCTYRGHKLRKSSR